MERSPEELTEHAGSSILRLFRYIAAEKGELSVALLETLAVLAVVVFCIWSIGKLLGRWAKNNSGWHVELLHRLLLPFGCVMGLIGIFLVWEPLEKSWHPQWIEFSRQLFYALLVSCIGWGCCRMIAFFDWKVRKLAERSDNKLDKLTVSMIGNSLKIGVVLAAFFFIGQNIFHFNITALLASAGVLGLSLALAAKDTVSNFFGTLVIIADSPFRIGDRIECGNVNGIVLNVGMRSSRIKLDDESVCTVPNSILSNSILRRIDSLGVLKHAFSLQLVYGTTGNEIVEAEKILHELLDDFHGRDLPGNAPHIYFSSLGKYSLDIQVIVWLKCRTFAEAEEQVDELNREILERFNAAGLEFAYPTQTLQLEK